MAEQPKTSIPARCCHCGIITPGLSSADHLLWTECAECAMWQCYLWKNSPPVLRDAEFLECRDLIQNAQ